MGVTNEYLETISGDTIIDVKKEQKENSSNDVEKGGKYSDNNSEMSCSMLCNKKLLMSLLIMGYILWALTDALIQTEEKTKFELMDPITKLYVEIGAPLAHILKSTIIKPDAISYFHLFIAAISSLCVASTNWTYRRIGAVLWIVRSILDNTDGALARLLAAKAGHTIPHTHIIDLDFVCDTCGSIFFGIGILVYFKRLNIYHRKGNLFFFGTITAAVFLKGFLMDYIMDTYEALDIHPSIISSFLWKISSYDSWDNLKVAALFCMSEYTFYEFTGYYGILWVGIPTLVSLYQIYYLN